MDEYHQIVRNIWIFMACYVIMSCCAFALPFVCRYFQRRADIRERTTIPPPKPKTNDNTPAPPAPPTDTVNAPPKKKTQAPQPHPPNTLVTTF